MCEKDVDFDEFIENQEKENIKKENEFDFKKEMTDFFERNSEILKSLADK